MSPKFALAACAFVLLGGCVPPEESNDKIKRYDPETNIMGQIQQRGVLRVGLPEDHPPFAIVDEGGDPEGFLVDMSGLIADSLGVEPEFVAAPSEELLEMVTPDPDDPEAETTADVVFPMTYITERLVKRFTFSDPYWVGHTRVIVEGELEGLVGHDVVLLRRAYGSPGTKIGGEQQSTEGYGAAVRTGTTTFATIVSQVVNEADAEGDWSRFYERWLAGYFAEPDPESVPIMSVEDAAALYPVELEKA